MAKLTWRKGGYNGSEEGARDATFAILDLLLFFFAAAGSAQSDRGTITGTVTDPVDAVVPGAAVVATHASSGARHAAVTTATGNYTIRPSLPDEQKGERLAVLHTAAGLTAAEVWERLNASELPKLWIPKREAIC